MAIWKDGDDDLWNDLKFQIIFLDSPGQISLIFQVNLTVTVTKF